MRENEMEETTLSGIVETVVFHNAENGYSVLEINADGELITCVGNAAEIAAGEEIMFSGKWDSHKTYGRQFRFVSCQRSMPDTAAKLFRYLASGAVKGIGPKIAAKIVERFGDDAADVLSLHPEKLAVIRGISHERAVEISAAFNQQYSMRKVFIELESYGITPSESARIFKQFGLNAVNVIRENPYSLCSSVTGFTFERAQKLCGDMELTPDPRYRLRAGLSHVMRYNLFEHGHTFIPRGKLLETAARFLGEPESVLNDALDEMAANRIVVSGFVNGEDVLFLPDIYEAESNIARRILYMTKYAPAAVPVSEKMLGSIEAFVGIEYAAKQRQAVKTAGERGLLVLTGGPGTGKTTAVRGIIRLFEENGIDVLLCAPTGMAAKRLAAVTMRDAQTIHRLLDVEWDDSERPRFRRDAQNPLSAGAIIVDEVSMVDVELFSSLLDAVPIGCRLILVGDADQLPSVGPGSVLNDLIRSDIVPVVCLTEIFRQAQKSCIVTNAHRIIHGQMPELGRKDADFFFLPRQNPLDAADTVCDLVSRRLPEAYGASPFGDIQVLCPSKKGDCGTMNMNRSLQALLNPPDKTKTQFQGASGRVFREGDRVMQTRNNYNVPWKRDGETGEGIFNGDIGVVQKIDHAAGIIKILFDDRLAEYPVEHLGDLELAYAVTVHKSQGNEYPFVIIPLTDTPPMLQYRNLLYTAVTRAKKILIVVGREELVQNMVNNNKTHRRYSALAAFLTE